MSEVVEFELFDDVVRGRVVDDVLEAEYGRPPERILSVDVQGHTIRVPESDTEPVAV